MGGWQEGREGEVGNGGREERGRGDQRGRRERGTDHSATELPTRDTGTERVLGDGDLLVDDSIGEVVLTRKETRRERRREKGEGELRVFSRTNSEKREKLRPDLEGKDGKGERIVNVPSSHSSNEHGDAVRLGQSGEEL